MKRKIVVKTPHVTITAVLNSDKHLTRGEVEKARDALADMLMHTASGVMYMPTPISKIRVSA